MHRLFDLQGQVALITGAGSPNGIGFATARMLAEMGAAVAINDIDQRAMARAEALCGEGYAARGYQCDLTSRRDVESFVDRVAADFGRIDILVNNAGMTLAGLAEEYELFVHSRYDH